SLLSSSLGMYCSSLARAGSSSGLAGGGVAAAGVGAATVAAPATGCPQFTQNFAPEARRAPQLRQAISSAVPQFTQNFAPSGLTVWQLGQFIRGTPDSKLSQKCQRPAGATCSAA